MDPLKFDGYGMKLFELIPFKSFITLIVSYRNIMVIVLSF